jgi:hypothetical protein
MQLQQIQSCHIWSTNRVGNNKVRPITLGDTEEIIGELFSSFSTASLSTGRSTHICALSSPLGYG